MEKYDQLFPNTCCVCGQYPEGGVWYATSPDAAASGQGYCETCKDAHKPKEPETPKPPDPRLLVELSSSMCKGLGPARLKTLRKSGINTVGDLLEPVATIVRRSGFSPDLIKSYQEQLQETLAATAG